MTQAPEHSTGYSFLWEPSAVDFPEDRCSRSPTTMARRLLRLQDLDLEEPSKFCTLWEANSLAAVARAVSATAHSTAARPHGDVRELNNSADRLGSNIGQPAAALPAAKRGRTGHGVSPADTRPGPAAQQHVSPAATQQQPGPVAVQKHVPASAKQVMLQPSRQAELPATFAALEVPQMQEQALHVLTDSSGAAADDTTSILHLHSCLLHDAASTASTSPPAQDASTLRLRQPQQQQPTADASMGANSRSRPLMFVEAFSRELAAVPQVPGKQMQAHNDLLLFYVEAAAAGLSQQSLVQN